jgi:hypothetical protein
MIGCELCQKTVEKYAASEIANDEICLACDTPLGAVKAEQDNQARRDSWLGEKLAEALKS